MIDVHADELIWSHYGGPDSECAFFNYNNQLTAELRYLLEDAHPDWKHKASRAGLVFNDGKYRDLCMRFHGKDVTLQQWFKQLENTEALWIREATRFEMPQFETTIWEY